MTSDTPPSVSSGDTIPTELTTEYSALRDEILARLGWQQQLIGYTFAIGTLVATALGLSGTVVQPEVSIAFTSAGGTICACLTAVYLKHHLVIDLAATYIAQKLSYSPGQGANEKHPFSGWDRWLASYYKANSRTFVSGLIGYAEASFPILTGFICNLIVFVLLRSNSYEYEFLWLTWIILNILALLGLMIGGIAFRSNIVSRKVSRIR